MSIFLPGANYVKLDDQGQVEAYPYTLVAFRRDHPNVSIRRDPLPEALAEFGVFPVEPTDAPTPALGKRVEVDTPELVEGVWRQRWKEVDAIVPGAVSMRQARLALLGAGLLNTVQAAIDGIADPAQRAAAQIDWEYATEVRRQSPLITSLGPALGLSEKQIDQLFFAAAAIE